MPNEDPIVPRQAGLQTLPFVREKLFASEQQPAPPTVMDKIREFVPFMLPAFVFSWAAYDKLDTGTELISPVHPAVLFGMCGLGGLIGIAVGIRESARHPEVLKMLLVILMVPAAHVVAFNSAAWRLANWWHFGGSTAEFVDARYPVKSAVRSKSGTTLRIDPFQTDEATLLPTSFDVNLINARPNAYCVTVQLRRASGGAVQVFRSRMHQPSLCS